MFGGRGRLWARRREDHGRYVRLLSLQPALLLTIAEFLTIVEVVRLGRVCRRLKETIFAPFDQEIWRYLLMRDFGEIRNQRWKLGHRDDYRRLHVKDQQLLVVRSRSSHCEF